jgi:hypothetical protein
VARLDQLGGINVAKSTDGLGGGSRSYQESEPLVCQEHDPLPGEIGCGAEQFADCAGGTTAGKSTDALYVRFDLTTYTRNLRSTGLKQAVIK